MLTRCWLLPSFYPTFLRRFYIFNGIFNFRVNIFSFWFYPILDHLVSKVLIFSKRAPKTYGLLNVVFSNKFIDLADVVAVLIFCWCIMQDANAAFTSYSDAGTLRNTGSEVRPSLNEYLTSSFCFTDFDGFFIISF